MNQNESKDIFDRVRAIFVGRHEFCDIKESPDSSDKKLIIIVPYSYVFELSALIKEVEETVQEAQIELEFNRLEDAFIKITESDIK